MSCQVRCTATPTESAHWVSVLIQTGNPWPLVLCVPRVDVTTVAAEDCSDLEQALVDSLVALGQTPTRGVEHRVEAEIGEVGWRHTLVRIRTSVGLVTCRLPKGEVLE